MDEILEKIERQKAHFGARMQPGCSDESIARLREEAREALQIDIPESYLKFLRRTDGLDWNGTVFFASHTAPYEGRQDLELEGIVPANLLRREAPGNKTLLILGESGMEMYALDLETYKFNIVDHISTDICESYDVFEDLFAAALEKRLLDGI